MQQQSRRLLVRWLADQPRTEVAARSAPCERPAINSGSASGAPLANMANHRGPCRHALCVDMRACDGTGSSPQQSSYYHHRRRRRRWKVCAKRQPLCKTAARLTPTDALSVYNNPIGWHAVLGHKCIPRRVDVVCGVHLSWLRPRGGAVAGVFIAVHRALNAPRTPPVASKRTRQK